jgi:hypothetical protein
MWASRSQTRQGFLDPTAAEAMAAHLAAQLCIEMGIQQVLLEGDAKNVISAVNSNEPDDSGRGQLTADICSTLRSVLARLAISETLNMVWLYDPPGCMRDYLSASRHLCFATFDINTMRSLFSKEKKKKRERSFILQSNYQIIKGINK